MNMRTAREAGAACLLVTDIDRGAPSRTCSARTSCSPVDERAPGGFVLNKFRGASLLAPGPEELLRLTGVPTPQVLPLWREHGLPEEDGVFDEEVAGGGVERRIAIVAYPHLSNLDDSSRLGACPARAARWARTPGIWRTPTGSSCPGRRTRARQPWMRARGLDAPSRPRRARRRGARGGFQILGARMEDPHGVEGNEQGSASCSRRASSATSLAKHARAVDLEGAWRALDDVAFDGYEIRHGRTWLVDASAGATVALRNAPRR